MPKEDTNKIDLKKVAAGAAAPSPYQQAPDGNAKEPQGPSSQTPGDDVTADLGGQAAGAAVPDPYHQAPGNASQDQGPSSQTPGDDITADLGGQAAGMAAHQYQIGSVSEPDSISTGSDSATSFAPVENLGKITAGAARPDPYQQAPGDASQDQTIKIKIADADLSVDFGNASE